MDAAALPPTTPAISADDAEMAQQVEMEVELDLDAQIWGESDIDECFGQETHPDAEEMAHQEQGDFSAVLDTDMDDGDLFGHEPQHLGSPKPEDAARQDSVQPAASQAQETMSKEASQPTGLALPRLALPKLAFPKLAPVVVAEPKPAPVAVAEQPKVVEPVITGRVEKKRKRVAAKGKGKGKQRVAYSGAQIPEKFAGQVTVRPAPAPFVLEAPREEDLLVTSEVFQKTLDDFLGPLDGDIEQQVAAGPIAAQPAENDPFMPVDGFEGSSGADSFAAPEQQHVPGAMGQYGAEIDLAGHPEAPIDLTMAEPAPAQQPPPVGPMAYQGAEIAQAIPPPPPPPAPTVYVPDDVDRDFQAGKWGRWNPKGMHQKQYVMFERQPYDQNNPRDIYDYLQAVVASIMRDWPGKCFRWGQEDGQPGPWQQLRPTWSALYWFDEAWKRLCESYDAQWEEKDCFLPVDLQLRLRGCHEWVANKSLLKNPFAEEAIDAVMAALVKFSQMPADVLQQGLNLQQPIVIE